MGYKSLVGEIIQVGFPFSPLNFCYCFGQEIDISQHQALYSLIGTIYGGDGLVCFNVPDLRMRSPIGVDSNSDDLYFSNVGFKWGYAKVELTESVMPQHSHEATFFPDNEKSQARVVATKTLATEPSSEGGYQIATQRSNPSASGSFGFVPPEGAEPTVELWGMIGGGGEAAGNVSIEHSGGQQAVQMRSPCLVINFAICFDGYYPHRP